MANIKLGTSENRDSKRKSFKEYKKTLDKLITSEKAIEQMESVFAGNKKAKGPLTKSDIDLLQLDSDHARLARKYCMIRTMEIENIRVWDEMFENIDTDRVPELKQFIFMHANFSDSIKKGCENIAQRVTDEKTYAESVNNILKNSIKYSFKVRGDIQKIMTIVSKRQDLSASLTDIQANVQRPIIGLIERMNGDTETTEQAIEFADWIERNGKLTKYIGKYTLSELVRMTAMPGSIDAIRIMRDIQVGRKLDEYLLSGEQYTDAEILESTVLNKEATSRMKEEADKHRNNLHSEMGIDEYIEELNRAKIEEEKIQEEARRHKLHSDTKALDRENKANLQRREREIAETNDIINGFYDGVNKVFERPDVQEYVTKAADKYKKLRVEEIVVDETTEKGSKKEGTSLDDDPR